MATLHAAAFFAIYAAAFQLRFDGAVPHGMVTIFWQTAAWVLLIKLLLFAASSHFRAWWGHVSFREMISLGIVSLLSLVTLLVVNQLAVLPAFIPRVVLLLDCAGTVLLLGALRSAWRGLAETALLGTFRTRRRRAVLVAAQPADKILAAHLQSNPQLNFRLCGYVDKLPRRAGEIIAGRPVLGAIHDLSVIVRSNSVTEVIVIAGSLTGEDLRDLRRQCTDLQLNLHLLPPLDQLLRNSDEMPIKAIDTELLLRRDPVQLDIGAVEGLIAEQVVLVTGAGGSIGSELCRQLTRFRPRKIVLVERSEPSLYQIDRELREMKLQSQVTPCLGDINDEPRMRRIFEQHQPDLVFHVAAHKHVPLLEEHVGEAIKNNVFGTVKLANLSHEFCVDRFVYISTDKAVHPSSVMGATKLLAESYVLALSAEHACPFVAVRFGNVLGSAGSVVPLFHEQIRRGGPITVTHERMERFFMTIAEAAKLVLQAASFGKGGEIFVLDMGEPVRVVDLAKSMVRMSGLPEHAIDLKFVGVRAGEKLFEELYFEDETQLPTPHPKLFSARHREVSLAHMRDCLHDLRSLLDGDEKLLLEKLKEWVPEYRQPVVDSAAGIIVAKTPAKKHTAQQVLAPPHFISEPSAESLSS